MLILRSTSPIALVLLLLPLLGACAGEDAEPWSPESADLVFMSTHRGNAEIYLLEAGSEERKNLTNHRLSDNWPEWSPDGSRISFHSNREGNFDIWVMDPDGSNLVRLTDDPAHEYLATWSPDGRQIAFASWRQEEGEEEQAVHTYIMNADGTDQRRWFPDSSDISAGVVWSPDGERLIVPREVGDQGTDLFLADTSGKILRRLTDDMAGNGAPAFSPDGTRIAYYADYRNRSEIVIIDADGSNRRVLVGRGQNWYPRWSPDGQWLVYSGIVPGNEFEVLAIRADGSGEPITLAGGRGRQAEGRWRPRP